MTGDRPGTVKTVRQPLDYLNPAGEKPMSSVAMIDPKKIRASKDMLRGCNKQSEEYQEMLASVKSKGIQDSLSVRANPDGETFTIINGFQRLNCALDLGLPQVPVHILDIEESDILEGQIVANAQKIETKPVEYTKALLRLLALKPGLTMTELAQRLGKSLSWLTERFHLLKLTPRIQTLVNEAKIPLASAYALAKCPEEIQEQLLEEAQTTGTNDFVLKVATLLKNRKSAIQQGKAPGEQVFIASPKLQKVATIQEVLDGKSNVFEALAARVQPTDARSGFILGLQYAIHMDPLSVDAAKADYEARQKKIKDDAEKRKAEREAKKKAADAQAAPKEVNGIPVAA